VDGTLIEAWASQKSRVTPSWRTGTTRHAGYGMSQTRRVMIEGIFGCGKQHGTMRKRSIAGLRGSPQASCSISSPIIACGRVSAAYDRDPIAAYAWTSAPWTRSLLTGSMKAPSRRSFCPGVLDELGRIAGAAEARFISPKPNITKADVQYWTASGERTLALARREHCSFVCSPHATLDF
jgi:hypothetical protein